MAASGTITTAIRTGYQMKIVWTVDSQSVANNTSTVTVKVQLVSTGSSYTINSSASKSGSLTINGTKYTFSFTAALSGGQTKTLYTKPVTIAHNADGSKSCAFAAAIGINVTLGGTYYGDVTASGSGKIALSYNVASVGGKNSSTYTLEYKAKAATSWTKLQDGTDLTLSQTVITEALFGIDSAYDIRLTVKDFFTTVRKTAEIPTAFTLLDFNASGKGVAFGKVSELTNGMEIDLDMSIYKNIFMGGAKRSDDEKNMYFQAMDTAQYPHNCKLYGGNGTSATSIGCWDSARSHGIWRYLSSTQNLVFDANVRVTRGNGGDEFVTSDPVVHGNRTGRVYFSNGLLIQWGTESITPVANTPTAKAVTFPLAYTDSPIVLTTAQTTVPGTIVSGDAAASITTTGFDCYVTRNSTTNTSVGWVAIGYKA